MYYSVFISNYESDCGHSFVYKIPMNISIDEAIDKLKEKRGGLICCRCYLKLIDKE